MSEEQRISQTRSVVAVPGCKVCNHPHRAEIDQMLILGLPYKQIIDNLGLEAGDLTTKNIGNHKRKHLNPEQACPEMILAATTGSLVESRDRAFELTLENQRLRAEVLLADAKLRLTQQAAVCMTVIDQLPNCLDQVTPKDVLKATEMLAKITGDSVERHHHEIDIVGELELGDETIKGIGDLLAGGNIAKFLTGAGNNKKDSEQ